MQASPRPWVMLAEQGLLNADEIASHPRCPRGDRERSRRAPGAGALHGRVRGHVFLRRERLLANRIDPETAGRLHTGRSRNDIDHTLFKLALRERRRRPWRQAPRRRRHADRTIPGDAATIILAYTHGQPAQPSTYGHYLGAVTETLLRDVDPVVAGARGRRPVPHGCGRDHHHRFPLKPRPHGGTARLLRTSC